MSFVIEILEHRAARGREQKRNLRAIAAIRMENRQRSSCQPTKSMRSASDIETQTRYAAFSANCLRDFYGSIRRNDHMRICWR